MCILKIFSHSAEKFSRKIEHQLVVFAEKPFIEREKWELGEKKRSKNRLFFSSKNCSVPPRNLVLLWLPLSLILLKVRKD